MRRCHLSIATVGAFPARGCWHVDGQLGSDRIDLVVRVY
jgi:hypothetical protein